MKTIKKEFMILFVMVCVILSGILPAETVRASDVMLPGAQDNTEIRLRSTSQIVATDDGYMRVYFTGEKIGIEYYDMEFSLIRKKWLDMELDIWGGFYAGADAYYIAEGQMNTAEDDAAEVIRVIKYDFDWNRQGAAHITGNLELFGGEVREPFDYGCVEMAESQGTLYLVTGHEGYVDPAYQQGHQGFLMAAVDEAQMTGKIVDCDLWHSFAQYIEANGSDLYVLEQSEGSRYTKLSRYRAESMEKTSFPVLEYGGSRDSAWAISCFASVDDMALSSDRVLCLGTSIDQSKYDSVSSDTPHNIYLTVTPMSDFSKEATTQKWLTDYSGGGASFLGTKITKIEDDRFLVSWEEFGESREADGDDTLSTSVLHYVFINADGDKISQEFTAAAPISDCRPIVRDSRIVYYASNANMVNFYTIDAQTGEFQKKSCQVAGESASWKLEDGVLTIFGSGAMSVDGEAGIRRPVSSTANAFSYSSTDNAWKAIRGKVKKIVISEGITSIPESAFENFDELTEVEIRNGLQSIGKKAFYECDNLTKITIPSTVTSIGEDFLWTGYYSIFDDRHIVRATIYAADDSYAAQYAKNNGIRCSADETENNQDDAGETITEYPIKTDTKTVKKDNDRTDNIKIAEVVPKKAVLRKLTSPKARKIKLIWKKDPQAGGYQIQYARNAKFTKRKKTVTIKKRGKVSKTISKLARHKKYYARVRVYYNMNGRKYYGAWSKVKSVRCK